MRTCVLRGSEERPRCIRVCDQCRAHLITELFVRITELFVRTVHSEGRKGSCCSSTSRRVCGLFEVPFLLQFINIVFNHLVALPGIEPGF